MLLCEVDQALNQDASIQPAEGLAHCYRPVVSRVCGITLLEDGCDQLCLPRLRYRPSAESCIEEKL